MIWSNSTNLASKFKAMNALSENHILDENKDSENLSIFWHITF